jgi:hypothetical protein
MAGEVHVGGHEGTSGLKEKTAANFLPGPLAASRYPGQSRILARAARESAQRPLHKDNAQDKPTKETGDEGG